MQVNKIIILGGGSAGWMTAAALASKMSHIDTTLIESSDIPTIGVGESTLGEINAFLRLLDLDEKEWMAACHATYKMSIDFTNWDGKETRFHYPFGNHVKYVDEVTPLKDRSHWFQRKMLCDDVPNTEYAELLFDTIEIIDNNKFTKNKDKFFRNFTENDIAYHFDATLFGEWLKNEYCKPKGVNHIVGTYVESHLNEQGYIEYIKLKDSDKKYYADLFIDCTGFNGLLIKKLMKVKRDSFSDVLINDRALATTIPYTDKNLEMEATTNATTMNAGWCWNIPLYNRIGTGYVYSSQFLTEDEAELEFREYLLKHRKPYANKQPLKNILKLNIDSGIMEEPWYKNVIAVGLSCGFVEPLESTGLLLTHKTIQKIISILSVSEDGKNVTKYRTDSFNNWVHKDITLASFIAMHYAFASREDTDYWKYIKHDSKYKSNIIQFNGLTNLLHEMVVPAHWLQDSLNHYFGPKEGISCIMAGMGYNPVGLVDIEDFYSKTALQQLKDYLNIIDSFLYEKRLRNMEKVNTLPTHYEYLKENIYNGEE